jgi:hypothetical protein
VTSRRFKATCYDAKYRVTWLPAIAPRLHLLRQSFRCTRRATRHYPTVVLWHCHVLRLGWKLRCIDPIHPPSRVSRQTSHGSHRTRHANTRHTRRSVYRGLQRRTRYLLQSRIALYTYTGIEYRSLVVNEQVVNRKTARDGADGKNNSIVNVYDKERKGISPGPSRRVRGVNFTICE